MFTHFPSNCTSALLLFSAALWSPDSTIPVHPCTTWQEVSNNTFGLHTHTLTTFGQAIETLVAKHPAQYAAAKRDLKVTLKRVWIPRGTDIGVVFVFFCLFFVLALVTLQEGVHVQRKKKRL